MKKRILCIDGGGIKGLYAAQVLAVFEDSISGQLYEYFDMIAGTSTGAIIGAGIALGIPVSQICDFYVKYAANIFPQNKRIVRFIRRIVSTKYENDELHKALTEVFQEKTIGQCKTRLVIPTYNTTTGRVQVFKTPHSRDLMIDYKRKVVDVLLSTTAAPTYLPPYKTSFGYSIDGGIGANNPSLIALIEGISNRCNWNIDDIYLLSLGSTESVTSKLATGEKKLGILGVDKIISLFMNAESQYSDNISKILLGADRYLRIDELDPFNRTALDRSENKSLDFLRSMGEHSAQKNIVAVTRKFFDCKVDAFTPCYTQKFQHYYSNSNPS